MSKNFDFYRDSRESDMLISDDELLIEFTRLSQLKRALTIYLNTGYIRINLILNNITILLNCFGPQSTIDMLVRECTINQLTIIKPSIIVLNIYKVGTDDFIDSIHSDHSIIEKLQHVIISQHI